MENDTDVMISKEERPILFVIRIVTFIVIVILIFCTYRLIVEHNDDKRYDDSNHQESISIRYDTSNIKDVQYFSEKDNNWYKLSKEEFSKL